MDTNGIQKQIDKLKDRINLLSVLIAALERAPQSLNEEIFQKYIEVESIAKVAKHIRDKGIRTKRNTSMQPNDISDILNSEYHDVDPALVKIALEIFSKNTKAVARQYW